MLEMRTALAIVCALCYLEVARWANRMKGDFFIMNCYYIIGLRINHRHANAAKLQELLTQYGCSIRLRVGLHETSEVSCSDDGVILLQACGEAETIGNMMRACNDLDGVCAKLMDLN